MRFEECAPYVQRRCIKWEPSKQMVIKTKTCYKINNSNSIFSNSNENQHEWVLVISRRINESMHILNKLKKKYLTYKYFKYSNNINQSGWLLLPKYDYNITKLNELTNDYHCSILVNGNNSIHISDWMYVLNNADIFTYDYVGIKKRNENIKCELFEYLFHPNKISKFLEKNEDITKYLV